MTAAAPPAPSCSSDKYCERCFYRGCVDGSKSAGSGVPFFEFRWSYFLNDATYFNTSLWPSADRWKAFLVAYESIAIAEVGSIDTAQWFDAANLVVSLCRGDEAGSYLLPAGQFGSSVASALPGYTEGYAQLESDPDCSSPTCSI